MKKYLVLGLVLLMLALGSSMYGCYKEGNDTRDYCCMVYSICFSCAYCPEEELHEIEQKRDQGDQAWCLERLEVRGGCEGYSREDAELSCE
jgi:hypothetical protein